MRKIITFIVAASALLAFSASNALGYNPDDYVKLSKTRTCEHCDLSGLIASINDGPVTVSGSNLVNSVFGTGYGYKFPKSNFNVIIATNTDFSKDKLQGSAYNDATLINAKFSDGDLSEVNFSNANLSGADLSRANMSGTNFSRAKMSGAVLTSAILVGSNISQEQLKTASDYCNAIMPNGEIHKC